MADFVNSVPCSIELDRQFFECEYDHKSMDMLETITGKGFYEIYERFLYLDNLSKKDTIDVISAAVYKHHGVIGMQRVKALLIAEPELPSSDFATFKIYFKNLFPDFQKLNKNLEIKEPLNKETFGFYDFCGAYSLARNCLHWSDTEFWDSTPRKLCFALEADAKYFKELKSHNEKIRQNDCINFLNGIKKIL